MPSYQAPVRDLRFVIHELLDLPGHYQQLQGCEAVDGDTLNAILEEGARFAEEVISPLNRVGDEHGCHWQDGNVTTPPGFAAAYHQFAGERDHEGFAAKRVNVGRNRAQPLNELNRVFHEAHYNSPRYVRT